MYVLDDRGSRVRFLAEAGNLSLLSGPPGLLSNAYRGALSLGVKRPGREADHSPPPSAEVKEWVELYLHSPHNVFMVWCLVKHKDNFTLPLPWYRNVTDRPVVTLMGPRHLSAVSLLSSSTFTESTVKICNVGREKNWRWQTAPYFI
jgi:hypothetical protein